MEGSYSKVWNARLEAPAEEYKFFVDSLMGTIRYDYSGFLKASGNLTLFVQKRDCELLGSSVR